MTRLRTDAALQRAICNHTDTQTGDILMAEKFINHHETMPNGRNSPDYGNTRLGDHRPASIWPPIGRVVATFVVVVVLIVGLLAVTP